MDTISYIPTAADNPNDEIGFKFAQVQPSAASYYLGWQRINFGDGDSTDFNYDEIASVWKVDSNTLTPRTRIVYTNNTVDTVYHTYMHNCMTYQVTRYAKTAENAECDSCMKSKTISVLVPGRPSLEIVDKDTICYGTSDTIIALSPMDTASNCTMDTNSFKYEWWYGNQAYTETPFYVGKRYVAENVTETTIIKIRVTDTASGFYRYKIDTIYVQAFPDITLTGDTVLCLGQTANITASDATGETVAMQWSFTEPASTPVITNPSTNPVLTFTPTRDTTVYLIAQTSEGCMAWKSIRIMITDPKVSSDKSKICPGESVVLTGSQAMDYSWTATPSDASLTEDVRSTEPVTVSPQVTTTYTMRGYGTSGCYAERQITITIVPYPTATITYSPNYVDVDDPILSIKDDSPNGASSMWTFSDGGTSTARTVNYRFLNVSVDSVGIELVSANELGCKDTTSVKVPVELFAVWVPNAFTPNGDGSNDYFFFMTRNQLEDVSFKIYNRWGENIFDREIKELDPGLINDMTESLGWDGKYKGKYVENGTYVWRLTYKRAGNTRVYDKSGTINVVK
jgi:gliding motility-associated-like protein